MCRFLLAKSTKPLDPLTLLEPFAKMTEKSRTFDGDRHGDGWGISWDDSTGSWKIYRNTDPVWSYEDKEMSSMLTPSRFVVIHARSASFEIGKGEIKYNQPYVAEPYVFVFNGLLKGVRLTSSLEGEIGAQKIWSLLQRFLEKYEPQTALEKVKTVVENSTQEVQALNIGLCDKKNIYSLNVFSSHPECYQLYYSNSEDIEIICSEPIEGHKFKTPNNQILSR